MHWTTKYRRWRAARALQRVLETMRGDSSFAHYATRAAWGASWDALPTSFKKGGHVTLARWEDDPREKPPKDRWVVEPDVALAIGLRLVHAGLRADPGVIEHAIRDWETASDAEEAARRRLEAARSANTRMEEEKELGVQQR